VVVPAAPHAPAAAAAPNASDAPRMTRLIPASSHARGAHGDAGARPVRARPARSRRTNPPRDRGFLRSARRSAGEARAPISGR
jgi:hypothetical protein